MNMIPRELNGWELFEDDLNNEPEALKMMDKHNGWQYADGWCMCYHKDKKDWIIVTEDGSSYKVDAIFSMWHSNGMFCAWSYKHLIKMIEAKMQGLPIPRDPDYQS